jgi:hypothetical protein
LAGGGVQGGAVYGRSDRHAAFPALDPVMPDDLIATVYHLLGVNESQMVTDTGGRPHIVRSGRVIHEILT